MQLNLQIKNLNVPLHSHLKNGLLIRLKDVLKKTDAKINFKNFAIKFGSFKIMRTFAAPFEKRVLERGLRSSLKRLKLYKKQVPRKTIYREALILLKELRVSETS